MSWANWDAFSRVASGIPSEKQLIAEMWVLWVDVTTSVWLPGDLFDMFGLFDPEAFWCANLLSRGHTTFRSKTWLFKGPNTVNTTIIRKAVGSSTPRNWDGTNQLGIWNLLYSGVPCECFEVDIDDYLGSESAYSLISVSLIPLRPLRFLRRVILIASNM